MARGVVLGSDGEIYLAGTFHGTADFGTYSRTSVAGTDAFLAQLIETGEGPTFQWVNTVGTAGYDSARALAIGTSAGAGTLSAIITVPVNGDTAKEANETFYVNLSSPVGATIADGQGLGTIVNDDGKPKNAAVAEAGPVEAAGGTAARTGSGSVAGAAAAKCQQPATIAAASQPADVAVPTISSGQRLDVRARERDQRAVDGVFHDLDTDLLADFHALALLP